ncbi:AI-2E family transporter [Psychroflexus montanilacus]|uniref:AI-2E family transporter n=1 Tax=Psychroflexus montanilacus TaxID=2873598 RepID=UPI001CCEE5C0|nr:AI-2E family transporter [Psychroflexus montanilacus]MBZ9650920.1 AI-2E family transporter [Psychroflexus montanilacus]
MKLSKGKMIILYGSLGIVGLYFLFLTFVEIKGILAPLLTAVILSLVILPLSNILEKKGMKRAISSLISVFVLFTVSLGFLALISFQIQNFIDSWPKIEDTMKPKVGQLKDFVYQHTFFDAGDLKTSEKDSKELVEGNVENAGKKALEFLSSTLGFLSNYLLTMIYIFFLLNYRKHFKIFMLKLFPSKQKKEVGKVIHKVGQVAQQYLVGKLMLITFLGVLYSIGLGISGIQNFILISIIAALLTLIPYIGNIIGLALALVFGYLITGELNVLIGIIITFTIAQFVESYILQPYVIGNKVDLHPFIVILSVIVGGALWGITGMILAIPFTAILGLIFLHVPALYPFGFLFSKNEEDS